MTFRADGEGYVLCDVFSTIIDMLSECSMTLLLLMLANGWMTTFIKFDFDEGLEVYAPLFMLTIMVHVMMGALTYIDQDAHHKYHDFHGWVGVAYISLKLLVTAVFVYFYSHTAAKVKKQSESFFRQVAIIGLIYLLSDAVIILSSYLLLECNRKWYYRAVDQSIHVLIQAYLLVQMRSARSGFTKSVNEMTSLPGLK